ncbi:fragment of conserved hypothetical protein (part 1) [Bradyrhizobium sp. STM 3809]|nr:fragment of conserved hypothetical protein (part 1) [Bradyrhizobium sp. STM 3809]
MLMLLTGLVLLAPGLLC